MLFVLGEKIKWHENSKIIWVKMFWGGEVQRSKVFLNCLGNKTKVWKIISARTSVWRQRVFPKLWLPTAKTFCSVLFIPLKNQLITTHSSNNSIWGMCLGVQQGSEQVWDSDCVNLVGVQRPKPFKFFSLLVFWKRKMPSTIWMSFHWFFQESIWL